jgi:dTDP-4-dehydrorhamnose reductase
MTGILLFGCNGQVGWALQRALAPLGKVTPLGRTDADFEYPESLRQLVRDNKPDVIVNAVAYTAVDKAEAEPERAERINAQSVAVLAEEARALDTLMIHYSTDYVFDGNKSSPYVEDDEPNPLSIYGNTKLKGERAIQASGCRHLVFRTAWVYGEHGGNFAKTILRLALERDQMQVVADQIGAPTSAKLIADVTARCLGRTLNGTRISQSLNGLYHLVAAGETTWCDYARLLVKGATQRGARLKLLPQSIHEIATSDYPTAAKRPAHSRLDTARLQTDFALDLPDWKIHLNRFLDEYWDRINV